MTNKYHLFVPDSSITSDINRLTNQLWKLIPMRENNENWKSQLDTVIIEITGLKNIFELSDKALILLSKLEGLKEVELEFLIYRKTVFECITLLREVFNGKN